MEYEELKILMHNNNNSQWTPVHIYNVLKHNTIAYTMLDCIHNNAHLQLVLDHNRVIWNSMWNHVSDAPKPHNILTHLTYKIRN